MTAAERALFGLARRELARNRKFKDRHRGESCYIFGNGASLKSMDLAKFGDRISIGCNSLFAHKDFAKLDCRYYQIPAPFLFYPYRRWYGRVRTNHIGHLYRGKVKQHRRTHFFTSLSNRLGIAGENISFTHHFGSTRWDLDRVAMDGVFSFMAGATYAMIGTALYMGFTSVVLVGLDYTFTPRHNSHFFEAGSGTVDTVPNSAEYGEGLLTACQDRLDLTTITPDRVTSKVKHVPYSLFTGAAEHYRENTEIVDAESLMRLDRQGIYRVY
jgi:hypothetical protein